MTTHQLVDIDSVTKIAADDFVGTAPLSTNSSRPRGKNIRWVIIAVLLFLTITSFLDRGNFSVAVPLISHDFNLNNTQIGFILSAFAWSYAVFSLPTGWLVDRFGPRLILTISALLWSAFSVFTGWARGSQTFMVLRAGLGLAEAPLFPAALKATTAWFPDREKSTAVGIYISGMYIGFAIAPPIATALMLAYGWPAMFIVMGALGFVALAAWIIVYRDPSEHSWVSQAELDYIRQGQSAAAAEDNTTDKPLSLGEWLSLFRYRVTWAMIIGGFCLQYVFSFYMSWLPAYLERTHHLALRSAGLFAAVPFIAGGVAALLGGRASDILVRRGYSGLAARRITITSGSILTAAAMIATAYCTNATLAIVLLTVGMFTFSLIATPFWVIASDVMKTRRMVASIACIQNAGGFIGGACAPIITGMILDASGQFFPAIFTTGLLALVAAVSYGIVIRRQIPL